MIIVSFEKELRAAFAAGRAAVSAEVMLSKFGEDACPSFKRVPKTYDEWIASQERTGNDLNRERG